MSPASRTIIHHSLNRYRYNETYPLLSTGRRKHNCPEHCLLTTLGAVIIFVVFATVFRIMPADNEFAWTNFESSSCTTYATREYVAELNVSIWNIHRMEICMGTSADVHGKPHRPSSCEVRSGKVVGHFAISHDEPDCVTYWSEYKDKGCNARGSKKRHIAQHLMNLPHKANYKEFCATTPARFLEQEFSGANSCETSIWGVWGHWFIDDDSC
ncbi:hypothetical protein K503DRAFT_772278 [Rhizopogon vinicolor AM-OR11-026]|uniref:Uncharacterized protein n=1 Tax=Rhizopogon vinicolor AM-OR11-026 TaxID=1314800 RepID=A0A1B7MVP9_9AGAM|nr:hypothetical protein K503DRAFT_772278 [Rhizopogon vinicolor AM-OR11-026]